MSAMDVPGHETGVVRLFSVDLPPEEIARFTEAPRDGEGDWPLRRALGAETLDPEHIEVFPVGDVSALGLSAYLTEGLGMPESEVAAERGRIDAVRGHVLVVHSAALGGTAQRLDPKPPLGLIGTYRERPAAPVIGPVAESEAARGRVSRRTKPVKHARRSPIHKGFIVLAAILAGAVIVVQLAASMQ